MREFACMSCGLYYWEPYDSDKFGYKWECPHCKSTNNEHPYIWACDTTGWAYYLHLHGKQAIQFWSSSKYAPDYAIDHYRKNGVDIRGSDTA